jgi:hypothetical protein
MIKVSVAVWCREEVMKEFPSTSFDWERFVLNIFCGHMISKGILIYFLFYDYPVVRKRSD